MRDVQNSTQINKPPDFHHGRGSGPRLFCHQSGLWRGICRFKAGTSIDIFGTASVVVFVSRPPLGAIPASFFGMTIGDDASYAPSTVPIGAVGHPTLLAWATMESARGVYDFSFYDKFANWAANNLAVWYYTADETGTTSYTPDPQFTQYRDLAGNVNPVSGPDYGRRTTDSLRDRNTALTHIQHFTTSAH